MLEPRVYAELRQDIIDVLESDIFENEKIKVIVKQMGIGKSYLQGNELPHLLQKNFPKLKFIIRVAPTLDTSNDDIFPDEKEKDNVTYKFRNIEMHKGDMSQYLEDL